MNRVWTEEELDILRRDRAEKVPIPVTAAKLGRPVPATYARARLIGTLVQPHQSWDEASVARLRELVSADPPMTDKRIAAELGRTVTQIRWKMQDLGLIGVRDLSKLARITAAETARPKVAKQPSQRPALQKAGPAMPRQSAPDMRATAASVRQVSATQIDPRAALKQAVRKLETALAERLKSMIAESEAGMVRAATDAIAQKRGIDQHIADLCAPSVKEETERRTDAKVEARKTETKRMTEETALAPREKPLASEKKTSAPRKPAARKIVAPAAQGVAQAAAPRPALAPVPPPVPKIVVTEAPAAARLPTAEAEPAPAQTSGRGGWKSVRRDPARIAAQAKAKATNRADAVDLAQAAQAAIERFIAERGVTRTETNGVQAVVARLQARGYIVVREGEGWVIDQRHRVEDESALVAFAKARGVTENIAA